MIGSKINTNCCEDETGNGEAKSYGHRVLEFDISGIPNRTGHHHQTASDEELYENSLKFADFRGQNCYANTRCIIHSFDGTFW